MKFDIASALSLLSNAVSAVSTVTEQIDQAKDAGAAMTGDSEAELEAKIAELEALLPGLRASTQKKLRGT